MEYYDYSFNAIAFADIGHNALIEKEIPGIKMGIFLKKLLNFYQLAAAKPS